MDFDHTEERRILSDTVGKFIAKDYPVEKRVIAANSDLGFSHKIWVKLHELGISHALFSEKFEGFGGHGFDIAVVFEALGKGLVVEPIFISLISGDILSHSEKHFDLLQDIISGMKRVAFAHFEEHSAYESNNILTKATNCKISGVKSMVQFANGIDSVIVSAMDHAELKLYLVNAQAEGMKICDYQTIDGGRAAEITLNNVIGEELNINAKQVLISALGKGILALSSEALGIMEHIKDLTIKYLQTRSQFGLQLGKFQALQHRVAEVLLEIEQARSAVINASTALQNTGTDRERALSACKMTIGRVGQLVAEEAIQLHGGIGMTWEYELGHYAKRLIMIDHELGDEDYHIAKFSSYYE
jgi:hypothetical protein